MKFKQIEYLDKFKKDLKKLLKRFPSLHDDIQSLINVQLIAYHKHEIQNHGILPLERLPFELPKVYKVLKFACKSLKGKGVHSGIRLTYAYFQKKDRLEFIEIYYKGDQENEDKERIKNCYNTSLP